MTIKHTKYFEIISYLKEVHNKFISKTHHFPSSLKNNFTDTTCHLAYV